MVQRYGYDSWLIFGDLDIITDNNEKIGGNPTYFNL